MVNLSASVFFSGGKSLESATTTSHTFTVLLMFNLLKPLLYHRHVSSRCSTVTLKFQTQPWTDNWTFEAMIITAEHGDIWDTWLGLETRCRQNLLMIHYFFCYSLHMDNMWTVEPPDLWIYNGDCLNPGNTCIKHLILACAAGDYAYQRNAVPFAVLLHLGWHCQHSFNGNTMLMPWIGGKKKKIMRCTVKCLYGNPPLCLSCSYVMFTCMCDKVTFVLTQAPGVFYPMWQRCLQRDANIRYDGAKYWGKDGFTV